MSNNEEFLYAKIRALENAVLYLTSAIGAAAGNAGNYITSGDGNPNDTGVVPTDTTKVNLRVQTSNGFPIRYWSWLPGATSWT
jgi:hypothetical protein